MKPLSPTSSKSGEHAREHEEQDMRQRWVSRSDFEDREFPYSCSRRTRQSSLLDSVIFVFGPKLPGVYVRCGSTSSCSNREAFCDNSNSGPDVARGRSSTHMIASTQVLMTPSDDSIEKVATYEGTSWLSPR